jgi:MoaA/NifB/PqqE/SkfB family radical SAM enzyme
MKGRRVLVVNPPLQLGPDFIDYPYFVLLGALSNAAALRERGFSVSVEDAQAAAARGRPEDVVVTISPFLSPHVRTASAAALFAGLRQRFPKARLAAADCYFGGMHYLEYDGAAFLRRYPQLDAVVKYEGETALPALLAQPPERAARVVLGRAADIVLDDLPFPAWDLISVQRYYRFQQEFFPAHHRLAPYSLDLPTLPAVTSRGCAFSCAFCTSNPGESRPAFRPHSPEYLARCFTELKTRFGARRLALLDGCPNHDPARFAEILRILKALRLRCEFPNGLRADRLDLRTLKALKPLAESLAISAESGDPEYLARHVRKGQALSAVERAASWCRQLGLPLSIHYMVGCPGETPEAVNRSLAHAVRMHEEFGARPLVQNFVPLPGSPWHRLCARKGLLRGFDASRLYRHFQGPPAVQSPRLSRERLGRMTDLLRRRLAAGALEKVIINLTYECPNDCRFCAVGDRQRRHGDFGRYARLLRDYRRRGISAVDLDGGEPTLYPGFFALVGLARRLGYERVTVTSNGRGLADRAFAARLLLSGLTELLISLHGHRPGIHEYHTRRKGSFAETVAGIRHAVRLRPGRVALGVNTTLTRKNAPHIAAFFRFAHGLGVKKVNVQFVTPFGHAARSRPDDPRLLWRHLAPALRAWRKKLRIDLVNAVPCLAGKAFPALAPDLGKHGREMVFADAPPQNLAAYLDARRRQTGVCLACEHAVGCAGFYVFGGRRPQRRP